MVGQPGVRKKDRWEKSDTTDGKKDSFLRDKGKFL